MRIINTRPAAVAAFYTQDRLKWLRLVAVGVAVGKQAIEQGMQAPLASSPRKTVT